MAATLSHDLRRGPVRVRVPATTANLGPGFDALGLALTIYNTVEARAATETRVEITGEGAGDLPRDGRNVLVRAFARGCAAVGVAPPALALRCEHAVPTSRGLGSSAAAVVAGLTLADALTDGALGRERVLALATEIEGHPDNAAPAVHGGLRAAVVDEHGRVQQTEVPVASPLRVALFVPEMSMPTREARAVLRPEIPRADAVYNISRTAVLVAALATGRDELLGVATGDALHQRAREAIFPAMPLLLDAAREAGALGAWLSGAGSTVAAFVREPRAQAVADAMGRAAGAAGLRGRALVASIDTRGALAEAIVDGGL